MSKLKRLCVFCGSSKGVKKEYTDATRQLAKLLCEENIGLVYGGANVGLMKELADAMLELGGDVTGVIPQFLAQKEIAHEDIAELHVVDTMQERKAMMAKLSDGFILLPGSIGSLDEFFEMATWTQLGVHKKPCGILNIANYYDPLLQFLNNAVEEQFLRSVHRDMMLVENTPEKLLQSLAAYQSPGVEKWIKELNPETA